ncbi:STAS domain-containing protein [Paenirhodobacter populi]|uniref:STAS domain-containing protein n=1 Tax=Paenirhodobacter populi TaxID=2306993 RepID=UPI000FE3CC50|nr:STAS domain-containing protein [Sinirhodobacter populi]RWR06656.1 anti-sigma factor antagonist [Sinirhodobacter populi]
MNLYAEIINDALVIHLAEDRLDAAGAIRFKDRMRELTEQPAPHVVLDLSQVAFLDSSGLGALVSVMKELGPRRRLELAGLRPHVEKVLHLTRMNTVIRIHPDVDHAVGRLRDVG